MKPTIAVMVKGSVTMADKMILYAARDTNTGKLVSDLTTKHKKFWEKEKAIKEVINKATNRRYPKYNSLELVTFELVEVKDDERM